MPLRKPLTLHRLRIDASFPAPLFPQDNPLTDEGVELGRRLFFDTLLSANQEVSCASCHVPENAFSDSRPVSMGVTPNGTRRNSMPLFNLAWRRGFFWDGRSATLREQVLHPIVDKDEMGSDLGELVKKLSADTDYVAAFQAAFGASPTSETLALALEQFLLVQISQDAKFDRARKGEVSLTAEEERGLQLFFTEFDPGRGLRGADCFHCHGNVLFTNERFANNGLTTSTRDTGRYEVTNRDHEKWCFKVPSLRNVALTGPYMHDGRFDTLEEVIEHYDSGVTESETLDVNLAKHGGPIKLSPEEKKALVAFLHTLTDDQFVSRSKELQSRPTKAASVP